MVGISAFLLDSYSPKKTANRRANAVRPYKWGCVFGRFLSQKYINVIARCKRLEKGERYMEKMQLGIELERELFCWRWCWAADWGFYMIFSGYSGRLCLTERYLLFVGYPLHLSLRLCTFYLLHWTDRGDKGVRFGGYDNRVAF